MVSTVFTGTRALLDLSRIDGVLATTGSGNGLDKTNLVTTGIPEGHFDYMMGRVTDTYDDVQHQSVEKLREWLYARDSLGRLCFLIWKLECPC